MFPARGGILNLRRSEKGFRKNRIGVVEKRKGAQGLSEEKAKVQVIGKGVSADKCSLESSCKNKGLNRR